MTPKRLCSLALLCLAAARLPAGPAEKSPPPASSAPAESVFTVFPAQPKQVIQGLGFEIQSDSIGSGNHGLPEEPIAVPHDLVPAERERLAKEMLSGFRYCRLAGGLYWRGLDAEKKHLVPRWPGQLQELKQLLEAAGVEGLSFEYWSPAPYWKANQAYYTRKGDPKGLNVLRCFGPSFATDPVYHGDTARFLNDFSQAVVADLKTLQAAGLKVSLWGLQNEPYVDNSIYSSCLYKNSPDYVQAYTAVAGAIRAADPSVLLFADTGPGFPSFIGSAMHRPEVAALVDAYAVHIVGSPASRPLEVQNKLIKSDLPKRPWFQNEYEYLSGGATPGRCLNTVGHIMNSFQWAENPTWFWIHCLKPIKNAEASGYALGYWKSLAEVPNSATAEKLRRWPEGPEITGLPPALQTAELITVKRTDPAKAPIAYNFSVNQPVTAYLLVQNTEGATLAPTWQKTDFTAAWEGGTDTIYQRTFPKGKIEIPAPTGSSSVAHAVLLVPSNPATFNAMIGVNLPIQIRSEALALERKTAAVQPGHWIYNPYNWNAVGSFIRHLPWNSVALTVAANDSTSAAPLFAFKRPNGKVTIVVANPSESSPHGFAITTGLAADTAWQGFRYTPAEAGPGTGGIPLGAVFGTSLNPALPPQSWEFWEQQ